MYRQIAEQALANQSKPGMTRSELKTLAQRVLRMRMTFMLGGMSVFLYILLYMFSADLIRLAQYTHQGHHYYFYVPVLIAFVFSFVHGAFTSHFWDVMGVKPRQQVS